MTAPSPKVQALRDAISEGASIDQILPSLAYNEICSFFRHLGINGAPVPPRAVHRAPQPAARMAALTR